MIASGPTGDCKLKCVKVKESEIINFTDTL